MNCHLLRFHLTALLDNSLDQGLASEADRHLAGCPSCSRFFEQQLKLNDLLRSGSGEMNPSPRIWRRIEQQIEASSGLPKATVRRAFLDLLGRPERRRALAGMALVFLLALGLLRVGPQIDGKLLAELDSYRPEIAGNPFLDQVDANPFLQGTGEARGNPFKNFRSHK
ncbi:MAG: anti-sigma factor family protein [Acidobacteriota bacterium]